MIKKLKKHRFPPKFAARCVILFIGLCFMGAGVALAIIGNLGITPVSSIPYVLSILIGPLTVGTATICMHTLFIIIQIIIMRKRYDPFHLLQFPIVIAFGYVTDFFNWLFGEVIGFTATTYWQQWIFLVVGVILSSFGVALEVMSRTETMAAEGLSMAISTVTKFKFTNVKVFFDVLFVVIAAVIGLIATGGLLGVREGTIFAAICTGLLCEIHLRYLRGFERALLM